MGVMGKRQVVLWTHVGDALCVRAVRHGFTSQDRTESEDPRSASGLPATAPGSTLAFFSPKVPLHDLRFVYAIDGRLYTDLSQRQYMLFRRHPRLVPRIPGEQN